MFTDDELFISKSSFKDRNGLLDVTANPDIASAADDSNNELK